MPRRQAISTSLVVLASTALLLAVLAGYARHTLFDSEQFANRAAATLRDDSVRAVLAQRITDGIVLRAAPDVITARPLIESAAGAVAGSQAVTSLFRGAAEDLHRAIFNRDENTATLTLRDVATVVGAAVAKLRPSLAAKIERSADVQIFERRIGTATGDLARLADRVRALAALLAGLTLVLAAGAIAAARDRRRAVWRLGLGIAAAGVVIVVGYRIARSAVTGGVSGAENRAAAEAVWSTFLGDLRTIGWIVAGCGVLLSATAASLLRPLAVETSLRRAWRAATAEPERTWVRVLRGAALLALGLLIVLRPGTALQLAAIVAGLYVLQKGIESLLRIVYRPEDAERIRDRGRRRARLREAAVWALAALAIVVVAGAFVSSGAADEPPPPTGACEGHRALCDRPFDSVALAATHNAMSVPLPGWFAAEQERPIGGQLEDGIRGLLLDTHYGDRLANGRVRTYFGSPTDMRRATAEDAVGPSALAAASRLRDRLGFAGAGKRGLYLCHTFCEVGATPLGDGLRAIHDFLVTHPAEVVVVVNQDYVSPADFVKAVEDAGLARYAYRGPTGGKWPTLGQMIHDDQRLVLLAENHAGGAPWYRLAYADITQETPFHFPSAAALTAPAAIPETCRDNRGRASAPLFLLNHWVSTDPVPRPSDAAKVNAYGPLLERARTCKRLRDRQPNLVAVNFYREGDVFRVVDTLNGVGPREP